MILLVVTCGTEPGVEAAVHEVLLRRSPLLLFFFFVVICEQNLAELVAKQQRMKYYQQAKEGRYTMLCRTESATAAEHGKQEGRVQTLSAIVDRLNQEFPHAQATLRRATLSLTSRVYGGEETT